MMENLKSFTRKEWLFTIILLIYIGGASYFWGATTNDQYVIIVAGFLLSHFVGNPMIRIQILRREYDYSISNRFLRVFADFLINAIIANILIFIIRQWYPGDLAEYLMGPVIYGLMYAVLYLIYVLMAFRTSDEISYGK